ncbi:MAG: flagellar biosynthetic protein FliO [Clostridiales bacterium]|nr:flagellar biosynthetic protein FliO [Clostridiales bacterium]HBM81495.1 flagellar biosynthesis protein FliZ [Clostridiaceae bacterium]
MGGEFAASIIKIIIFLPMIILLAYISIKIGGRGISNMTNGRIIKIIEKVPLSGKAFLCVAQIEDKYYALSCTEKSIDVLMELSPDIIKQKKNNQVNFKEAFLNNFNMLIRRKDKL